MEWYWVLLLIVAGILILFSTGTPVAFSFGILNIVALYLFCGGERALKIVSYSAFSGIANFMLVAIPMFILMGDAITYSGMAFRAFNVIDKLLGRVPARLSVLTILNAMMFGSVSGSSMACCAAVGKMMIPEMMSRGYDKSLVFGSVIGGAALDILIPPSVLVVIYGSLANVSIGKLLVGGVIPGIMIGGMFILYVIVVALINPKLAPASPPEKVKTVEKLKTSVHILPLMFIFFLVMGLIYLGVVTTSEAGAIGAGGAFLLAFLTKGMSWGKLKNALTGTANVSGMIFLIVMGSKAFSQLLAYTGVTTQLAQTIGNLPMPRWVILIGMQTVVTFLGFLMDPVSIMYILIPVYEPIVRMLHFDPIWFGILMMINLELGSITPPFGMNLFVAKGIAPPQITMLDIYISVFPFAVMHLMGLVLVMIFPGFFLWLPNLTIK